MPPARLQISVDAKPAIVFVWHSPALGGLALPLRTQLRSQAGECWEANFPQGSVLKSDEGVFKAKQ
jgi:hypothetical protein